ncbi:MAG: hypothetical protein IIC93_03835 [Chloroflexi bacterium]|nr:hypothetical protein [Chloroflexota bacterium]
MTSSLAPEFKFPDDLEGFWQWDKMHLPRPLSPQTQELYVAGYSTGFTAAMDEFAYPVGFSYTPINYYGYNTLPPQPLGDETMEERLERHKGIMHDVLPRMGELWENEWLPSMMPGIDRARSTDYGALSDSELLETYDSMHEDLNQRFTVHGKINFVLASASLFADFYNAEFSPEDPTEPYECLQGFPTRSLDAGRGLWALRNAIMASATVTGIFENSEPSEILAMLDASDEGRKFRTQFDEYLDEFGWRTDVFEVEVPTWREDPEIPLNTLQGYISLGDDSNPEIKYEQAIATRERLTAEAREKLAGNPEKLGEFNRLYEMAKHYLPITENHNYWIDQIGNAVVRLPLIEMGERLAKRGAIADADDVYMLFRAEIAQAFDGTDQSALAKQRRAEMAAWATIVPPPMFGEPPPPPEGDPMFAGLMKMFGLPAEPSDDPDVINGTGASAGVVQGTAKVVKNLSEASKLRKGDILVTEMTMPPWTPLFSTVSAVVADTGGVLSHCAIVSREYRIPCVVGTIVGTSVIKDGMQLTVDGSQGIVRIDSR